MKNFFFENWYKLMIGSSLLMASFGFMVHSITPAMADNSKESLKAISNYKLIPTNADGSINVKLNSNGLLDVNLTQIGGHPAACTWDDRYGQGTVSLNVFNKGN